MKFELPAAVVDEAIRLRWFAREGRQLVHKGFDQAERDEALAGWVNDEGVRLETVRGLRIDVALEALRVAHRVEVTRVTFDALLAELAPLFRLTVEALKAEAKQDPQVARQLAELAQRAATVSFVMSKVTIREPPDAST